MKGVPGLGIRVEQSKDVNRISVNVPLRGWPPTKINGSSLFGPVSCVLYVGSSITIGFFAGRVADITGTFSAIGLKKMKNTMKHAAIVIIAVFQWKSIFFPEIKYTMG